MDRLSGRLQEFLPEIIALNDYLANHPELSGEEYLACKAMTNILKTHGFQIEEKIANLETSFRGIYGANNHTYKVAILAEYDALKDLGHGCGHCVSGSISMLAALALAQCQEELDTDIHIIGTPGEELYASKCDMVNLGVFDDYDLAIMLHLNNKNLIHSKLYAIDTFQYNFHGKAAHAAAAPWEGANALNAVQLFFHAMDMLRQHVLPDTKLHGIIVNGGSAANIVPDEASVEINIRSGETSYLDELNRLVDDCARGAAIATQTTWDKSRTSDRNCELLKNETGVQVLGEIYRELGIQVEDDGSFFGSSDIGNVSYKCPTFHPTLNITEDRSPIHTQGFANCVKTKKAHQAIELGAKVIGMQILKIFSSDELIKKMKEDFNSMIYE
ncbi:N-acyl-L-amino acid amidohydrolase [Lachnospiraceae bacterium TWA4]|nr:N-acyl-L-amino acid amidohydrolase [Lachnospiraceae bacterium TWA4]